MIRREGGILSVLFAIPLLFLSAGTGDSQANLLLNPGFEDWAGGEPDHWTMDDSIAVAQDGDTVHGGSYSARVTLLTQNQNLADFWADTVTVSSGSEYSLLFWVLDNDASGRTRPFIWWYRNDGSHIANHWGGTYSSDTTAWQQLVATDSAPAEAGKAVVGLRFYDIPPNWTGEAIFWVDDAFFGEGVGVDESRGGSKEPLPFTLKLSPNPVWSTVLVSFTLRDPSRVSLTLHDVMGRRVGTVWQGGLEAGRNSFCWNPSRVGIPSGPYFLRLMTARESRVEKMLILR